MGQTVLFIAISLLKTFCYFQHDENLLLYTLRNAAYI